MKEYRSPCLLGMLAVAAMSAAYAETFQLKLVPEGFTQRVGGYAPQRLSLSDVKPAGLKKGPEVTAPRFATLQLGAADSAPVYVILDEPEGKDAHLYVDSNRNGDLLDDKPAEWLRRSYKAQNGQELTQYMGSAWVDFMDGGTATPVKLVFYRFDKNDPARAGLKDVILYYGDFGREGELRIADQRYKVLLRDGFSTGDFRGRPTDRGTGIFLQIDRNGNGVFEPRGEVFDAGKPFNIGGTTYEVRNIAPSGAALDLVKSDQVVEEILPPPDLSVGKKAVAFDAMTTDGKAVSFPSTYKGKLVLLDFWATWCGPCIAELPHLTAAYEKYHPRGLEVLGISLDRENAEQKLAGFTKEKKMPWPQVYDGKFWEARVAVKYGVNSIPRAYLVDGDTGLIVATGPSLRGASLEATLEKALGDKAKP